MFDWESLPKRSALLFDCTEIIPFFEKHRAWIIHYLNHFFTKQYTLTMLHAYYDVGINHEIHKSVFNGLNVMSCAQNELPKPSTSLLAH